jgi:deoxyribose-phosphate aldolase
MLNVIIETAYLSPEEIVEVCSLCADAGTDFVKTSTGYAPSGATVEAVKLMRKTVPSSVGVKASGGIRDYATAKQMIDAGADRIGTSSTLKIIEGSKAN